MSNCIDKKKIKSLTGLDQTWYSNNSRLFDYAETYDLYFAMLYNIVLSMYEWEGLPQEIKNRNIEMILHEYGHCVIFINKSTGRYVVGSTAMGYKLDNYAEVSGDITVTSKNGESWQVKNGEYVIIYNNPLKDTSFRAIHFFAKKLSNTESAIDVNLMLSKFMAVIKTSDNQKRSVIDLMNKWGEGKPFVVADKKGLQDTSFEILNQTIPYNVDKLDEHKEYDFTKALNYFGIKTANTQKKERLITDEVNAIDELTEIQRETWLFPRNEGCKELKRVFGLDVSVSYKFLELEESEESVVEDYE